MRAILTYHAVDDSGSPVSVDEQSFGRHVAFLASGRVPVLPLEELAAAPDGPDAVALTFDDGLESFATRAWPLLRAAGLPVSVFLVTGRVGSDNSWGGAIEPGIPEMRLMDWATVGRLAAEGVRFEAHGRSHAALDRLAPDQVLDEVARSRDDVAERTGREPVAFAYPYGRHDARSVSAVRGAFRLGCTTRLALLAPDDDAHLLPRVDAWYLRAPGRIESFGSRAFRRHVRRRALLRSLRARARGLLWRDA